MNLISVLSSINPPKMAGVNEMSFKSASETCPALEELNKLPPSPFNEGLRSGLSLLFDALSDTGLADILSELTLERMTETENKIKKGEMDGVLRDLPKLKAFTASKDAFGAGVFLSFAVLYDMEKTKASSPERAIRAMSGDEEELEEDPSRVNEETEEEEEKPAPRPASKTDSNWQLNNLLLSLEEKGISLDTIHLEPVKIPTGAIELHITGLFQEPLAGAGVSFSDIAKINAIFKSINSAKDIVLYVIHPLDAMPGGQIGFKYRV